MHISKYNTLTGHKDCVYSLVKNPNNTHLYSADGTGIVAIWDLENAEIGKILAKVPNSVYSMAFWENENTLIIGQNFSGIHFIDITHNRETKSLQITENYIFCIKIIENIAFVGCGNGELVIIDLINTQILQKIQILDKSIRSIDYLPSKQHLAVACSDFTIKIFEVKNQNIILKNILSQHTNSVFSVKYHPSTPYLLSAGRDAKINAWDIENYTLHTHIPAHWFAVNAIAYSPDGRYFASGSMDKSIKIWDSISFRLLKVLDKSRHAGHGNSVNTLFWDNNFLLSAGDDRQINLWKIDF